MWACSIDNEGEPPPFGALYFPTALELSPRRGEQGPKYLYVANSNFDLRYRSGSLQAFNLDALYEALIGCAPQVADPHMPLPEGDERESFFGEDCNEALNDPSDFVDSEVHIGSFAAGMQRNDEASRLYVPTRSDSALTFVEVDDRAQGEGVLSCSDTGRRCDRDHVLSDGSELSPLDFETPIEPIGVVAGKLDDWPEPPDCDSACRMQGQREAILLAHRGGAVSLFVDEPGSGPQLTDVRSDFFPRVTNIAYDPLTRWAYLTAVSDFFGNEPKELQRVGVARDAADPLLSSLVNDGRLFIRSFATGRDTRAAFFGTDLGLRSRALVLARQPSSLIGLDLLAERVSPDDVQVQFVTELGSGPSRVAVGRIASRPGENPDGERVATLALVTCFGARELFIVDLDSGSLVSVVQGFSGPFDVVVDERRRLAYVGDFRTSVLRVVDLAPLVVPGAPRAPQVVGIVGRPRPPQEIQ